jgi:hypothetical protein
VWSASENADDVQLSDARCRIRPFGVGDEPSLMVWIESDDLSAWVDVDPHDQALRIIIAACRTHLSRFGEIRKESGDRIPIPLLDPEACAPPTISEEILDVGAEQYGDRAEPARTEPSGVGRSPQYGP